MSVRETLLQKLAPFEQEQLLSFWDELSDEDKLTVWNTVFP